MPCQDKLEFQRTSNFRELLNYPKRQIDEYCNGTGPYGVNGYEDSYSKGKRAWHGGVVVVTQIWSEVKDLNQGRMQHRVTRYN